MSDDGNTDGIASVAASDDRLVVRLRGELNMGRTADIQGDLIEILAQRKPRCLVLNLTEVPYMDSSGIAVLLVAQRRLGGVKGCVILVGVSEPMRGLLKAVKLDTVFPMVETEEAAIART